MLETPAKLAKSINLMLDTICQNDPKLYDFIESAPEYKIPTETPPKLALET